MANVLIVDDEEMDRFIESRIVEDAGHTPIFAGDGEVALQMYEDHDIALVITDLQMPKVDGLRFIRDLLAYDPGAEIIAVSGHAEQLEEAKMYGARSALLKPVEPARLIQKVQSLLARLSSEGDLWGKGG